MHNLKAAWPTKISMPVLSSVDNMVSVAYIIFQKRCWLFWDQEQNMLIFD